MSKICLTEKPWKLFYMKNCDVKSQNFIPTNIKDFSLMETLKADLPSCFEYVLYKNNIIDNPFYSDNILSLRKWESYHQWYFTTFDSPFDITEINFKGIDTISEIYINGEFLAKTDNMFMEYNFSLSNLKKQDNEIVIHIFPFSIESKNIYLPAMIHAPLFNYASLTYRKCASSFGWDILPRIVCGGIYREIYIDEGKNEKINESYLFTNKIEDDGAYLSLYYNLDVTDDDLFNYEVELQGKCGDSKIYKRFTPWHTTEKKQFIVQNPKLWNMKGYGEPNLYSCELNLYKNGNIVDCKKFNFGIRTIRLDRTSLAVEPNAKFEFVINGQKVFILGTNWVTTDAYHREDNKRAMYALNKLDEIGCNAIRIWGGSVYERDEVYDYCDRNGIVIWQDFMLGCAVYPETDFFFNSLREEAEFQVKRLREHPSIILWAGDNECDIANVGWAKLGKKAKDHSATRKIIKEVLNTHDTLRPYIPSSPYVDENCDGISDYLLSESHIWGPRDYFKGDFYRNTPSQFASEVGYHGCPSPNSLDRFLKNKEVMFEENGNATREYNVHSTNSGIDIDDPYLYRTRLMDNQVKTLFGNICEGNKKDIYTFAKASQISQAEAMKYFIERFRIRRNTHGGIIWWNILDGWPQVSDAIIDYYFTEKLAVSYIKRSQNPVCIIGDEDDDNVKLYLVNDTDKNVAIICTVKELYDDKNLFTFKSECKPYTSTLVKEFDKKEQEKNFYYFEWKYNGKIYSNHFHTNIIDISFEKYNKAIEKIGYNLWHGFEK